VVQLNTSSTSVQDKDGWSTPQPGQYSLKKETRYSLHSGLDGPQGRSGQVSRWSLRPTGVRNPTAKSVGGRQDNSFPAPEDIVNLSNEDEDKTSSTINYL
jgi:hypothetical protein